MQVLCFPVFGAMINTAYVSDYKGSNTFQGTIGHILGNVAYEMCSLVVVLANVSSLCSYLVAIGDQWEQSKETKIKVKRSAMH